MSLMPDPTFYPSPGMAMKAAPEHIAYVCLLNVGKNGKHDAMGVIDVEPQSPTYGQLVSQVDFPGNDNELHRFGWNACSACLCPQNPHPHMERRYLIVPGIGSSRIHILDTKADPAGACWSTTNEWRASCGKMTCWPCSRNGSS